MIMVLAGTKEARFIAAGLEKAGFPVAATTAYPHGSRLLRAHFGGKILSGPLDEEGLKKAISGLGASLVVDATHPFAVEISANAARACAALGVELVRFEREGLHCGLHGNVTTVSGTAEACREAQKYEGPVFLATGSSTLEEFAACLGAERLVVRVLPTSTALCLCEELGIGAERIVAMQGPFSRPLNEELFRRYNVSVLVTKESGKTGGLQEKVDAARLLGIPVIVIDRPASSCQKKFSSIRELEEYVRQKYVR